MLTLLTFSRIDLDVINRRDASLLVVPLKSLPLIEEVLKAAATASPLQPLPEVKGVDSMAEVLPLVFPTQYKLWKEKHEGQNKDEKTAESGEGVPSE